MLMNTLPTTDSTRLGISVVTSAWNIERLVGETIRSVVSQKQPGDQYVFVDGASADRTAEIARGFGDQIDVMISEPDDGQYHGIMKGFDHATGDIQGWLNADDILMPWTFSVVREVFDRFPDVDWITGSPSFLSDQGQLTRVYSKLPAYPRQFIANGWFSKTLGGYLQQESMFWRRGLWDKVGGLDLKYALAGDFDLWTKFARHADLVPVDVPLAAFRERPGEQRSSASEDRYQQEVKQICADKPRATAAWRFLANRGTVARSFARLMIRGSSPAIVYNRRTRDWQMTTARRSISRQSLGTLIEEWRLDRLGEE